MPHDGPVYWVDAPLAGRIAVVERPRGATSFLALKSTGVDVLVSMLAVDEAFEIGLGNAPRWAASAGIEFLALPVTDHGIPTDAGAVSYAVDRVRERLREGRGVAAHCFAGLGRSPLFVAATLIASGYAAPDAIKRISEARGFAVPEMKSQHEWLHTFAASRQRS
jgi:hypothetical protein